MTDAAIELVEISRALRDIDPAYTQSPEVPLHELRINALAWSASDSRLYVVIADRFVFASEDGGGRWQELPEVNRNLEGTLHPPGTQHVDLIVDTVAGTVLLVGRCQVEGEMRPVTWRKPAGHASFMRVEPDYARWGTSKAGNIASGFIGSPPRPIVAFTVYETPAAMWYSIDDGLHWAPHDLELSFKLHAHEVYLPRSANTKRTARLWVSGGDDPSGERSGVITFDRVEADGRLGGHRWALRERSGYRFVGLTGDGKHVYIGNESIAGGMLRVLDNLQSIDAGDFEYVLGKSRHDYHQFRSMVATPDGMLVAATDSYAFTGDTIRADSGGYLYLSSNGGASFRELSLGMKWITGVAHDGTSFWVAGGMNRENASEASAHGLTLLRVPKPGPGTVLADPYCVKALVADSSGFYTMARYDDHPHPLLGPGERTFRTDLSPYASIAVDLETLGPGTVVVEALPYQTWHPDEDPWRDVLTLTVERAESVSALLPPLAGHNRWFRVRNDGSTPLGLRRLTFVARR